MPALENPRWERFSQLRAKGLTQEKAYEQAGFVADRGAACRLSANISVQARIAEITERAATRVEVNKAWVIDMLRKNAVTCLGLEPATTAAVTKADGSEETVAVEFKRDPGAANTALQLIGKELGMFVDRSVSATTTLEELLDLADGEG